MAKKNKSSQFEQLPVSTPETPKDWAQQEKASQLAAPVAPAVPATRAQILTFWGVVVAMVAAARLLDAALPGTPERVIERWLMLPFAAFLAVFLYKLK